MKTSATLSWIASLAAMVSSIPWESRDSPASILVLGVVLTNKTPKTEAAQSTVNVYVCRDINFGGDCQNLASSSNQCYNLGNGFDDSISSLGPSKGVDCNSYNDNDCNGDQGSINDIAYPGISNLVTYDGGKYNDVFSSYVCY